MWLENVLIFHIKVVTKYTKKDKRLQNKCSKRILNKCFYDLYYIVIIIINYIFLIFIENNWIKKLIL